MSDDADGWSVASASEMAGIVGEAARNRRTDLGLTQAAVARSAGIATKTYGDLERGVDRNFEDSTLKKIARALGWEGDHLINLRDRQRPADPVDADRLANLGAELAALTNRVEQLTQTYDAAFAELRADEPLVREIVDLLAGVDPDDLAVLVPLLRRWLRRA